MVTLMLITVGFVVATVVVIVLARASTAGWERDKRAPVAVRGDVPNRRPLAARAAFRTPGATARRMFAALRGRVSRFPPVRFLARFTPTGREQGTSRIRLIRRVVGVLRSSLFGGKERRGLRTKGRPQAPPVDGEDTALTPQPSRAATDIGSDGVAGTARRRLFGGTVPRARRRALVFLHRHEAAQEAHVPHDDGAGTPTAG